MSESEHSLPQDDSDEDIYKDIPEFNFEDELAKLEGTKETYKQEASDLSEKVKALTEENKELKKSNEILKKNLSTLLKTAQTEVQRKDSMIDELRTQVDSNTHRLRNKIQTKDKYTSTDDLIICFEAKYELNKPKECHDKIRSKSFDNQTRSNTGQKLIQDEKRKEFSTWKENSGCDSVKILSNYREKSKASSRHSDSSRNSQDERHRDRKSSRYEDNFSCRRSFRENHRDHLKYDSYDKKRHSKSSDRRCSCSRQNSRDRRSVNKKEDSSEKKRRHGSSKSSRKSSSKRHRSCSRGSKKSSSERLKTRSCLNKDSVVRIKEPNNINSEMPVSSGNNTEMMNYKDRNDLEKQTRKENDPLNSSKNKQIKEKFSIKQEKRNNLELFSTKSPLDALYNDMITSRNANRFSNLKQGLNLHELDYEEDELSVTQAIRERQSSSTRLPEKEDWTFSFKNERQNEKRPMTLYSRRMMRKFSLESKTTDRLENKREKTFKEENEIVRKMETAEKEPGELTDDENIVESSKEFQELTKVAVIDSEIIEKSVKEKKLKEPARKESRTEKAKENEKEFEKLPPGKDEVNDGMEIEQNKEVSHEVIEFSPFKNNYRLIEISPIKPPSREHVLDFYNKKGPPSQPAEPNVPCESEEEKSCDKLSAISEEKELWKNSSSEKDSETELKIVIFPVGENPNEIESKKPETKEELKTNNIAADDKTLKNSKKEKTLGRGKRKVALKEEKPVTGKKSHSKKRILSKSEEENENIKKPKIDINETSRKSKRVQRNSKSIPETKPEPEKKIKEDISSFEFFKPIAKTEAPQTPVEPVEIVSTISDYKMTATMSVTGVVRLETPNKCVEKLKNLTINEQMIFNVLDSKNDSQFSPLIGSKCIEMTPRRMLKNDLMLTDSEDDSVIKKNIIESDEADQEEAREEKEEEEEEEEEEDCQLSGIENSECGSDSGASDFVDLL